MLASPTIDTLQAIPPQFLNLHSSMVSLPLPDPSLLAVAQAQAGKRPWETSKAGYLNWATERLLVKTKEEGDDGGNGSARVGRVVEAARSIGSAGDLRLASEAAEGFEVAEEDQESMQE